jgi:hypothetical protein
MSVDISCRKRPGAEEDLCMPVILQLLLASLSSPPVTFIFCLSFHTTLQGSAVLRSYMVLMGTMTLSHSTPAIENDKSF